MFTDYKKSGQESFNGFWDLLEEQGTDVLYERAVSSNVLKNLEYDRAEFPHVIKMKLIYPQVIQANSNLQKYLGTSKEIFDDYVRIGENALAENFFIELNKYENR
jgi:hypothetical protein